MRKKTFISILFLAALIFAIKIKAGNVGNVTGTIFGDLVDENGNSLVGNIYPGDQKGNLYIPLSDGQVTGYVFHDENVAGFGGNLGWIDFDAKDNCVSGGTNLSAGQYKADTCTAPDGKIGGVSRVGNQLVGWARFVSIAEEANNAGGLNGWINFDNPSNQVTIDPATGKLSGQATSELGNLSFNNISLPVAPVITLNASPNPIDLQPGQGLPAQTSLTWTSNQQIDSCTATCVDDSGNAISGCSGWSNDKFVSNTKNGTIGNVVVPANAVNFKLTCVGTNGLQSNVSTARVLVGCAYKVCASGGSGKCAFDQSTFTIVANGSDSKCADRCSTDSDCAVRQTGTWKEVAP